MAAAQWPRHASPTSSEDDPLSSPLTWRLKRLSYLLRRVGGSLAQRGLRGTVARIAGEFRPVRADDATLTMEPLEAPRAPFVLPTADASPAVSVIVPVHGKIAYTLACLRSLARHGAHAPFEVIVVDDASPDDTAAALAEIDGLRLLRNTANLGFIGSCNAGAAAARGAYLLFLNNDTQVTPGWLDRLLDCFAEEPACGIAGSRLVYPGGRLQEAGGLVYGDGSSWNVGRFEQRNDPRFLYRRDVDYVSGAALMIEAALFAQIGGFDTRYAPAYCEDMDLAFAVRAARRRVIYQPESMVVHCEGISSGLDPFSGIKQYQTANRTTFAAKWTDALARQPAPGMRVEAAIHARAGERHILVIDALMPDPTRDSGSLRLVNILQLLHWDGWRITFMPDNRRATPEEVALLGRLGVEVLCMPWAPSLATWLARHGGSLDAAMLCRHYVAAPHLPLLRRLAPRARIVFDTVDLHFVREQRAAEHGDNRALARQALSSKRRELELIHAVDASFVVSPVELALLHDLAPEAQVELLSNVHEVYGRTADAAGRRGVVFIGGFAHPPNVDAAHWLVETILPVLQAGGADIPIHLIGDIPDTERRALARPGVTIHGRVADLAPWMSRCRAAVAPLRYGAGVKGKVNMAMSHGLPVVATTMAAEGMQLVDGHDVLLADDPDGFAAAIHRLHEDDVLWTSLSDAGLENVRRHFSFDAARRSLRRVFG